jgi:hypothetical protein
LKKIALQVFRATYQEIAETSPVEKMSEKPEGRLMGLAQESLENGEALGLRTEEKYAAIMPLTSGIDTGGTLEPTVAKARLDDT